MPELRWNPLLGDWVMSAPHRQGRPQLPTGSCPFCPGVGKTPKRYEVYAYDNDFPSLMENAPPPAESGSDIYPVRPLYGKCEVVLYHPDHQLTFSDLLEEHILKIIGLWRQRYVELGGKDGIDYVFIFENKGESIGVTIHHPHGQIYAYPFIPLKIARELEQAGLHRKAKGTCLFCDMLKTEKQDGRRILEAGEHFAAFVPFFAEYSYEVMVFPERHIRDITEFSAAEDAALAGILKRVTVAYDRLFGFSLPYMMVLHQRPTDGNPHDDYHFHIEFYPLHRSKDKIKYLAGSETGAWAHINVTSPEATAEELRRAFPRTDERPPKSQAPNLK